MAIKVPAMEDMGTDIAYKHFNLRHMPCGGVTSFRPSSEEDSATLTMRAYHDREHEIHPDMYDHSHKEPGGQR